MILLAAALLLQEQLSEKAKAALNEAVETVDGWVGRANTVGDTLTQIKENAEKAQETQELLEAAVKSRDPAKMTEAIKKWFPDLADHLDTVEDVDLALKKLNPALGAKIGNRLDEALLVLADKARELNGRALKSWSKSGLATRINRVLEGKGRLGKAVAFAAKIKEGWEKAKGVKEKYDEILKDIEDRFDPTARDATAGLRAIHGILGEFAADAPPPIDKILGAYAQALGGTIDALLALESRLNENARQMNLMRSLDSTKDGVLEELRRKYPEDSPFDLTEIPTPDFLKGRFFECRQDRYYLYTADKVLHQLNGTLDTLRRVGRMLEIVKAEIDPERLSTALRNFLANHESLRKEFGPYLEAVAESRAVYEPYLRLYYDGDKATADKAVEDVTRYHRWEREEAMAWIHFSEPERSNLRLHGQQLLYHALVEVDVVGEVDPEKLSVWAQHDRGGRTTVPRKDGAWRVLLRVDPVVNTGLVVGGAQAGDAIREVAESLPRTPAIVRTSLRVEPRPKEPPPAAPPPLVVDDLLKDNAAGPPPAEPPPPDPAPGAGSGAGTSEPGGDKEPPPEEEELKKKSGVDTDPGGIPDETAEKVGGRPEDLGDPGFDGLLDKLLTGDRAGAEKEFQRLTGCKPERAKKEIDGLLGEQKSAQELGEKGKGAKEPFTGPKAGPDDDFLKALGLDPGAAPPLPGPDPDAPPPDLLKPPPGQDPGANPFAGQRQGAAAGPDDFLRGQQGGAQRERAAAADQIAKIPIPTRGGMAGFDVGQARTVTITVWDNAAEDGDRVRILVGSQVLVGDLTLRNAPQSFEVALNDFATPVRILALNEGTSPPNTASLKVSVGGREIRTSGWSLKANGMGDTLIRRAGP